MNNDNNNIDYKPSPNKGKVIAGAVLLVIGAALLLKQLDIFFFPGWLISWPMWLIVWGLYIGGKHNFRNSSWAIMVIIGGYFLLDEAIPNFDLGAVFWPVAIIGFGVWLIMKRNHSNEYWDKKAWKTKWEGSKYKFNNPNPVNPNDPVVDYRIVDETDTTSGAPADQPKSTYARTGDEHLDAVSIFGGVKKIIFSKDFQGGEIVNVFGGAEIDLTQADINGRVYIELTQIFGGTKIIVPPHWTVISDMAAIFAGFDDKRVRTNAALDTSKVLIIKGTSVFGGTDIRSY
jgi:predicted membrane protein